jgi:hypothetical protein
MKHNSNNNKPIQTDLAAAYWTHVNVAMGSNPDRHFLFHATAMLLPGIMQAVILHQSFVFSESI